MRCKLHEIQNMKDTKLTNSVGKVLVVAVVDHLLQRQRSNTCLD
jgi:hypothetical protein